MLPSASLLACEKRDRFLRAKPAQNFRLVAIFFCATAHMYFIRFVGTKKCGLIITYERENPLFWKAIYSAIAVRVFSARLTIICFITVLLQPKCDIGRLAIFDYIDFRRFASFLGIPNTGSTRRIGRSSPPYNRSDGILGTP